jgi:hypothetical protein
MLKQKDSDRGRASLRLLRAPAASLRGDKEFDRARLTISGDSEYRYY